MWEKLPDDAAANRNWNGNNAVAARTFFGLIPLSQSPVVLRLSWKKSANHKPVLVGVYTFDLHKLLDSGYVYEPENSPGKVRLRFQYSDGGVIELARRRTGPSIEIGSVSF